MSEKEGPEEPTMEEILASIRKIISEDDVEEETPEPKAEPEVEPEPEEDIEIEAAEPILELTEEAEPEDEREIEPEPEEELEIEPEPEEEFEIEPEPEPEPEPEIDIDSFTIDDVDPADGNDVLMSDEPADLASNQFGILSDLLTSGYQGSGNTLEGLVREMLKPMLREWLDKNLPPVVERMVAKEIARLARTKKP